MSTRVPRSSRIPAALETVVLLGLMLLRPLLLCGDVSAETLVVEGEEVWEITLTPAAGRFTDPQALQDYSNESNGQVVRQAIPDRIVIERRINLGPISSRVPLSEAAVYEDRKELAPYLCPEPPFGAHFVQRERSEHPESVRRLAERLAAGLETQLEYVNAVMYDLRDRLVWRMARENDAATVLKRGHGTCAGFAALAVALLRVRGIPARCVVVETLKHPTWNAGAHGEVEVYFDDIGWVSYDPQKHHHHAPYPRVRLGHSTTHWISSSNEPLWRANTFFRRNGYYVKYRKIRSEVRTVGRLASPEKYGFISRRDGRRVRSESRPSSAAGKSSRRENPEPAGSGRENPEPAIAGRLFDGSGAPLDQQWIFVKMDPSERSYRGRPLFGGSYRITNDGDGGRLYLNQAGYIVFYDFTGTESTGGRDIEHDIRFDPTDSIVIDTGKPNSKVYWSIDKGRFFIFKAGPDGTARLHLNEGDGRWMVNGAWYAFRNGMWEAE